MQEESGSMLEAAQLERAADVLKTVAHPMRLQIVDLLDKGERTVTALCQLLGAQQPYVSQQLNLMKAKGVLSSRRSGNQVFYVLADPRVAKIIQCVREQADTRMDEKLKDSRTA
ncbi:MAG: ArsR/SmtB family transcription factor [Syntrophobacteraceae bacterium]